VRPDWAGLAINYEGHNGQVDHMVKERETNVIDELGIPFSLDNPWAFSLHGVPLRCSVPLPEGAVKDPARELVLLDEKAKDCGAQWRVLSTWDDGSARFALMDYAEAELAPRSARAYTLKRRQPRTVKAPKRQTIKVKQTAATLTVDTGRLTWKFSRKKFSLGTAITCAGRDWLEGQTSDLCVMDELGTVFHASAGEYSITVEEKGPHRAVVLIEGNHGRGDKRFMDYWIRLHFIAGGAQVLMMHHIRNRHGGREGRKFQHCRLEGGVNVDHTAERRIMHIVRGRHTVQGPVTMPERIDIDVVERFIRIRNGDSLREDVADICPAHYEHNPNRAPIGDRRLVEPAIDLSQPGVGGMLFKFAMADPAAEFPMHLGSELNRFEIDFFPAGDEPFLLGEGMGKTRDVLFNFHDDSLDTTERFHESNNLAYPGVVSPGAAAFREAKFADMHRTLVPQFNKYMMVEQKIDLFKSALKGCLWPLAVGWKDYGDEWGARGGQQYDIWQAINNEEDYLWCCMIDAWRLGEAHGGLAMARHLMDIDYIDYSDDPGRDGADCPHSDEHTNGEVYPSHQWCQGLLYFYLSTGDEEALRIAKRIGDNLHWWVTGPNAYAMRASGRETAWPLLSLAALYEVTHEARYKKAALQVVDDMIAIQKEHGTLCWEYPLGSGVYSDYMLTMVFNGLWDVWAATGEKRVLKLWKSVTEPVIARLEDPDSWGYVIFRNWPLKVADLTVLVRWYEVTGDERYIRLGKNGLRLILAAAPQLDSQFLNHFAMWYRHAIHFLKNADELGMIDDDHVTLVW
jgi:hypothetical protein